MKIEHRQVVETFYINSKGEEELLKDIPAEHLINSLLKAKVNIAIEEYDDGCATMEQIEYFNGLKEEAMLRMIT